MHIRKFKIAAQLDVSFFYTNKAKLKFYTHQIEQQLQSFLCDNILGIIHKNRTMRGIQMSTETYETTSVTHETTRMMNLNMTKSLPHPSPQANITPCPFNPKIFISQSHNHVHVQ